MERYLDVCDACQSRELDFIFFDLQNRSDSIWIKDIPGYRCRACEEVLLSSGVIDVLDEQFAVQTQSMMFPLLRYQKRVMKSSGLERDICERILHSWNFIKCDGREKWDCLGFRVFGDLKTLVAI